MSRTKRSRKRRQCGEDRELATRELGRGNTKQALKHAKAFYRIDPGPASRSLLQEVYVRRIREFQRRQMVDLARSAFAELQALGPPPSEHQAEYAKFQLLLGGSKQSGELDEMVSALSPEIIVEVADESVLNGPSSSCPTVIRQDTKAVREALEAVENGDDEAAKSKLSSIGRTSPLADWKLFVRGLIAFYSEQWELMEANWSRLNESRPAHHIAQALTVVSGRQSQRNVAESVREASRRIWHELGDSPLVGLLQDLSNQVLEGDWDAALATYRRLANRFKNSEPGVIHDVTDVLWRKLVGNDLFDEFEQFGRHAPPLRLDPRLHRARALLAEAEHDLHGVEKAWLAYIDDLRSSDFVADADRQTAVALVFQRIADVFSDAVNSIRAFPYVDEETTREATEKAEEYYRLCLEHDPKLREAYFGLADLIEDSSDEPGRAAEVYQQLVDRFPDDHSVLLAAASHFHLHNNAPRASDLANRAIQLRPRDRTAQQMAWMTNLELAMGTIRDRKFGLAQQYLDSLSALANQPEKLCCLEATRAALEFKRGDCAAAERHVASAHAQVTQSPAACLAVASQAMRSGVAASVGKDLTDCFRQSLEAARSTETAGMMARCMKWLLRGRIEYRGFATHRALVIKYLRKCRRLRWNRQDLGDACEFCGDPNIEERKLLADLADRGKSLFPKDPHFCYHAMTAEMMRGPQQCNVGRARRNCQWALELHRTGGETALSDAQLAELNRADHLLEMAQLGPWETFGDLGFAEELDDDPADEPFDLDEIPRSVLETMARMVGIDLDKLMGAAEFGDERTESRRSRSSRKTSKSQRKRGQP